MPSIYTVIAADLSAFISGSIQRVDDDGKVWSIPLDPANSDYQRYLRWLENPEAEERAI